MSLVRYGEVAYSEISAKADYVQSRDTVDVSDVEETACGGYYCVAVADHQEYSAC